MSAPASFSAPRQRTLFGHPIGLYVLFLTQMWERFSYFGMLALLIIYLNKDLQRPAEESAKIFKWYTSLIYFTPLVGGFLADRILGNKRAVLIGAVLMAVGHFLMTFPALPALFSALVLLVVGCGLLTPPLTSQVGLLYPPHDPRRDSGYTLFYMGINLGALASPILCGWLVENTRGRYHAGFALAGFGMLLALVTYVIGLPWIVELDQTSGSTSYEAAGPRGGGAADNGSNWPLLNRIAPRLLWLAAILLAVTAAVLSTISGVSWDDVLGLGLAALCSAVIAAIAGAVRETERDRVLAIVALAVFAILFWAGSGQSGNAINLWAEQNTNRYLTRPAAEIPIYPETASADESTATEAQGWWERWGNMFRLLPARETSGPQSWSEWWASFWNPVPTAWFQSINPLLILLLAPFMAMLWTKLARRGLSPSIPMKMALGLLFMALAFGLMVGAATREASETSVSLRGRLPNSIAVNDRGQLCRRGARGTPEHPYAAGRLFYDAPSQSLRTQGVLSDLVRDVIVADSASDEFGGAIEELKKRAEAAQADKSGQIAEVQLQREPAGFDLRYAGFGAPTGNKTVSFNPTTHMLRSSIPIDDKEVRGLKVAGGDPALRAALDELMVKSNTARVSPVWLAGFFLLATLGELCLSPIGLSMVSQLAPPRFASLLMSVWLLTFSFGNFVAGDLGERWGVWAPTPYFTIVAIILGVGPVLMLLFLKRIRGLMHGVENS